MRIKVGEKGHVSVKRDKDAETYTVRSYIGDQLVEEKLLVTELNVIIVAQEQERALPGLMGIKGVAGNLKAMGWG